ncbi:transposase [Streptomyces sp. NPDC002346]
MTHYLSEFKADAVALYESRPEATIRSIAAELGVNLETWWNWVRAAGASRLSILRVCGRVLTGPAGRIQDWLP